MVEKATHTSAVCPVCHAPLEEGKSECGRCGFKLAGKTESFAPVIAETQTSAPASGGVPILAVVKGPYAGEEFILGQGSFTLGRNPGCDVFLNNMTVSRVHAIIEISGTSAVIKDKDSLNGTWVDGDITDEAVLIDGSHVQIGTFDMIFKLS